MKKWLNRLTVCFVLAAILICSGGSFTAAAEPSAATPSKVTTTAAPTTAAPTTAAPTTNKNDQKIENIETKTNSIWDKVKSIYDGVTEITTWINPETWLNKGLEWLLQLIVDGISSLYKLIVGAASTVFFDHSYVKASLKFFKWIGRIALAVGFLFGIYKEAEKHMYAEPTNLGELIMSFIKGLVLFEFIEPALIFSNNFVTTILNKVVDGTSAEININLNMSSIMNAQQSIVVILFWFGISVYIFWAAFKRLAVVFIQILIGYVYVLDVIKGNTNVIGEYVRDVASSLITFFLQIFLYRVGASLLVGAISGGIISFTNANLYVGIVMLVGAVSAPSVLRKWGFTTQQSSIMQKASSAAMLAGQVGHLL